MRAWLRARARLAAAEHLRGVREAEEMLRFHILQGRKNERGNYGEPMPCDNTATRTHDTATRKVKVLERNVRLLAWNSTGYIPSCALS